MPIITRKRTSEKIIDYVLEEIEKGNLRPGEKMMSEREFAETLGVSRVPYREAIVALSALGIVESRQGDGTFVNRFNEGMMGRIMYIYTILDEISAHDLLEMRAYLESAAAMLAARCENGESMEHVREAAFAFERTCQKYQDGNGTKQSVFQADDRFHTALAACGGNRLLMEFLEAVRKPVQKHFNKESDRRILLHSFEEAVAFHNDILEAVVRRDEISAYQIMQEHVLRVARASSEDHE